MNEFKVIVPLDGSQLAEAALEYLPLLYMLGEEDAGPVDGYPRLQIRLVGVADVNAIYATQDQKAITDRQTHLLQEYLLGKQRLLQQQNLPAVTSVRHGSPASVVLEEAESFAADLIILTTHGRSGFQRWRIGSVADKIIRMATCDTLVIGPRSARPGLTSIRSILVPLDGSPLAEQALPRAQQLAAALKAQLYLMRIVPPQAVEADIIGVSVSPETLQGLNSADAYLTSIRDRLGGMGTTVLVPTIGPAADRILDFIAEKSIDLVVMTSHGRGGVLRAALGSVTDRLLGGPAPILVVHPVEQS